MRKRILITGVTGFVGSWLAELLVNKNESEIFGVRRVNSRLRNIKHLNNIKLLVGDLTDIVSMIELMKEVKPDQIYHLGALSWVTPSWSQPVSYMYTNAIGTINLFEAMRLTNVKARVLVSCTPEEFGDVKPEKLPITEKTEIHPVNPYAASKVAQDAVCMSYAASYGFEIIRTRAFNHEGPRRDIHGALASFAYQIACIEASLQEPVIKVGNLSAKRSFTDVRDCVNAYYTAMEKCVPGELYLIGTERVHTIKECLEMLIKLSSNKDIKYEIEPARVRPTELHYLIGDCKKFRDATGWEPKIPFEETLVSILDYWRGFVRDRNNVI